MVQKKQKVERAFYSSYEEALRICEYVAKEEYNFANEALARATDLVDALLQDLRSAGKPRRRSSKASADATAQIAELERMLNSFASEAITSARRTLEKKAERLSKFTVTLFGRTMAGKSTIREAITHGDGGTIGKGAQRTTRDIREYDWNELRIVDTPGIGAYEGDDDRELALSVVDESDLLLFLVSSDGIQETAFRAMKAIRSQNKPIVFVLNVKLDLERGVNLRRFLRDPRGFLGDDAIRGHVKRIERLAFDELGMRDVRIVAIHAQAAFLTTREQYAGVAKQLHAASGIDRLLDVLTKEVRYRGPVRRLQTFLDGTINQLLDLEELLLGQAKILDCRARYLRDKFSELDTWLDGYIGSVNERIEHEASILFRPLRTSVSSFVDDNLESSDVRQRWRRRVDAVGIDSWMSTIQQQLLDEVYSRLEEFNREIDVESELTDAFLISGIAQYDPWDVKRTLRWTSAAGAALYGVAAVAGWIGGANFWNPVGWISGVVSIVAFGLSWLFEDREKKLQKQKAQAARQLRDQIDYMERRVANQVKSWFYKNITKNLVKGIRTDTRALCSGMFSISNALRKAAASLRENVEQCNRRLILKTGMLIKTEEVRRESIGKLVRDPGLKTKLLWEGDTPCQKFCRDVGLALGEWIDGIPRGNSTEEMVARALVPARIDASMVTIKNNQHALVSAPESEIGRAIGKSGHNVSLASQLLNLRIEIRSEGIT
ncbi:MAG: hypothetical protein KatS3mg015_3234 [Fimbriimonadales bacterium]|nr:MAG: hypothetical protein KatS3mg015_3234 [Fimbriimonadales bacterium]